MLGNVWELCLTDYSLGSTDLDGTNPRVLRGASWINGFSNELKNTIRAWSGPDSELNSNYGFRVASFG